MRSSKAGSAETADATVNWQAFVANRGPGYRPVATIFVKSLSAAGLRLRNVLFDAVEIGATNRADEATRAVINVNHRNGVNIELMRHGCSPPDNVDLAQGYLRIVLRHLLQVR